MVKLNILKTCRGFLDESDGNTSIKSFALPAGTKCILGYVGTKSEHHFNKNLRIKQRKITAGFPET